MGFRVRELSTLTVFVIKLVLQDREAMGNVDIQDYNYEFQVIHSSFILY